MRTSSQVSHENHQSLPDGWGFQTIEQVCEPPQYGYTQSATNDPIGPKFVRITDIASGSLDWDSVPYCSCSDTEAAKYLLSPGDLLFARTGSTGYSYLVDECPRAVFASYLIRLKPMESVSPRFLKHFFTSSQYWQQVGRLMSGSVQTGLNATALKSIKLLLPSLPEQHRIAHVLDTMDKTIARTERMIEKLRVIKSGLLQDLLTRGIGEDGEIRQKPAIESATAGWKPCKLGDLFRIRHGYAFKGEYFDTNGPYIVLTPGNFYETGGFRSKGDEEKYYTGQFPREYILDKDDLIVAMTEQTEGLLGASAIVPESDKYLHNQRLGLVVGLDEARLTRGFLFTLFNSRPVRSQIQKTAAGTKVRHTSPDRIYQVEVVLPPPLEQLKIVSVISSVERCMELEEFHREKAMGVKQGLMADLLSGRVRVNTSSQEGPLV